MKVETMAHRRFEFVMHAPESIVFDAFHYHHWRKRWDSLVSETNVQDDAPCPFVGAVTQSTGAGVLRALSMTTEFVAFERPNLAAATMRGHSFPFKRWAASMRHRAVSTDRSLLIYTYNFEVGPTVLRWVMEPLVVWMFNVQTRRRFKRLQNFLALHADEVAAWQKQSAGQ
jgi:hypothetical protein